MTQAHQRSAQQWVFAVLILFATAYLAHFLAIFISFDLCCRPTSKWGVLPIPRTLPEALNILGGLSLTWAPSIALYYYLTSMCQTRSFLKISCCLAISLSLPSVLSFGLTILVSGGSGYSEWGGEAMLRNGIPTLLIIKISFLEAFFSLIILTGVYFIVSGSENRHWFGGGE